MSRRLLRCRNPACPVPHGAVLGRVTEDDGIVLDGAVTTFAVYLDTQRVRIQCPACGASRNLRTRMVRASCLRS